MPGKVARCSRRLRRTSWRVLTSSAASGSSSSRSAGSVASARASATRWACPPDSCAGRASANRASPTRSSHAIAVERACTLPVPRARRPNATFSRALRWAKSTWSWKTTPIGRRSGGTKTSAAGSSRTTSSTRMRPASMASSPDSALKSVDLPEPFGPSTASTSPAPAERSTSRVKSPRRTTMRASRLMRAQLGLRGANGRGGRPARRTTRR